MREEAGKERKRAVTLSCGRNMRVGCVITTQEHATNRNETRKRIRAGREREEKKTSKKRAAGGFCPLC